MFAIGDVPETDPKDKPLDKIPYSLALCGSIQSVRSDKTLLVLFYSGSTSSWINKSSLPRNVQGQKVDAISGQTMAGTLKSSVEVTLSHVTFPEFFRNRLLELIPARVFKAECRYDMIIGRDVLGQMGMLIDFEIHVMTWDGQNVAMRPFQTVTQKHPDIPEPTPAEALLFELLEEDLYDNDEVTPSEINKTFKDDKFGDKTDINSSLASDLYASEGYKSKSIDDAKYNSASPEEIARKCTHLSQDQQNELADVLRKHDKLFDGELCSFNGPKVHLEIDPTISPKKIRGYDVPRAHEDVFKTELDRLVRIGVLEPADRSEWISGTFIIPKKDGTVRWVSDFRALNKALRR